MNDEYTPPPVWTWNKESGGRFANINRPVAGKTHDRELPVGRHPLQLYSLGTPNGVKVTVMLEELLALGHAGAEYDAWLIRINEGAHFGSGFVAANPNSKIPALLDRSGPKPIRVFESGAILMYLAEKFGAFLPTEPAARAAVSVGRNSPNFSARYIRIAAVSKTRIGFGPLRSTMAGILEFGLMPTKPLPNCSPSPMRISQASYSAPLWPLAKSSSSMTVTLTPFGVPCE